MSGATDAPPNAWFGMAGPAGTQVSASCALGAARWLDRSSSVWVAVGGRRYLDIVQVGALVGPAGRRYFAAWGNGIPDAPGSSYEQRDLGPADGAEHAYQIELDGQGVWRLRIDGEVALSVPDTFRDWPPTITEAYAEAEGAGDDIGGTPTEPTTCRAGLPGPWHSNGFGARASSAGFSGDEDGFAVWRPDIEPAPVPTVKPTSTPRPSAAVRPSPRATPRRTPRPTARQTSKPGRRPGAGPSNSVRASPEPTPTPRPTARPGSPASPRPSTRQVPTFGARPVG